MNKKNITTLILAILSLACVILCLVMWILTKSVVNMILFFVIVLAFVVEIIALVMYYKEKDDNNEVINQENELKDNNN